MGRKLRGVEEIEAARAETLLELEPVNLAEPVDD
jgi:hypothetical protein